MEDFQKSVEDYNYIVLGSDSSCNIYKSLRSIANDINIDHSTISKKLKSNTNTTRCFVTPKCNTDTYYYIVKF